MIILKLTKGILFFNNQAKSPDFKRIPFISFKTREFNHSKKGGFPPIFIKVLK
jgi:hypothetical protein